jgi:hypothetical protein
LLLAKSKALEAFLTDLYSLDAIILLVMLASFAWMSLLC